MNAPPASPSAIVSERDRSILRALASRIDGADAAAHNNLGVLYFNKRMLDEALEQFGAALAIDGGLRVARVNFAYTLRELDRAGEAEQQMTLLQDEQDVGDGGEGIGDDEALLIRQPQTTDALLQEPAARPSALPRGFLAFYHRGVVHRERGEYAESVAAFREALDAGEQQDLVEQAMAEVYLVGGQPQEAAELYDGLLRRNQKSPKLWNERGVCHHVRGELQSATRCYMRALEFDADYGLAENNLAVAHANRGDNSSAIRTLAALTGRSPFAEAFCNLGLLAVDAGRTKDAIEAYRRAAEAAPERPGGWLGLAAALAEEGNLAAARNSVVRAVELAPDSAEGRYRLAFILNRLGDVRGSLDETRKALALDPYFTAPRPVLAIELQFEYSEVLAPEVGSVARVAPSSTISDFSFESGQLNEAIARLRGEAADRLADPSVSGFANARKLLARGALPQALAEIRRVVTAGGDPIEGAILSGEALQRQGLDGEAVERFESAAARLDGQRWGPFHSRAWLGLGSCLLALDRVPEATEAADMLAAHAPGDPRAEEFRAETLLAAGAPERALEILSRLAERDPDNAALRVKRAVAARESGQVALARRILIDAVAIDPDLTSARLELGALLLAERDFAGAAEQGRAALGILPGYAEAARLVADAEVAAGRPEAAISILVELLEEDSYHLPSLLFLGRILLDTRRVADARVALRRVMRLDSESAEAWSELSRSYEMEGRSKEAAACRAQAAALAESRSTGQRAMSGPIARRDEPVAPSLR